jgi:hypothetical protein
MHLLDFTKEIHVYVRACTEGFKIELTGVNMKYKAKNEISRIMILTNFFLNLPLLNSKMFFFFFFIYENVLTST